MGLLALLLLLLLPKTTVTIALQSVLLHLVSRRFDHSRERNIQGEDIRMYALRFF